MHEVDRNFTLVLLASPEQCRRLRRTPAPATRLGVLPSLRRTRHRNLRAQADLHLKGRQPEVIWAI